MKWMLTGAAAIALAASGAMAQPGGGNGNGNGHGQGNGGGNGNAAAHADHGSGGGNSNAQANRGNGNAARPAQSGPSMQAQRSNGNGNGNGNGSAQRAAGNAERAVVVQRSSGNDNRSNDNRGNSNANRGNSGNSGNGNANRGVDVRVLRDAPQRYVFGRDDDRRNGADRDAYRYVGLLDGCPPGLAAKHNGCQPPGQARKHGYYVRDAYDLGWWGLPRYDDWRYRYDSGYLLRIGTDGRVSSYIPLLGGALAIGRPWPTSYGYNSLSPYYTRYYDLGSGGHYRYADNVVYRLDPQTAAITSIAALLTGDDFVVGQPVPRGYDVYNVPPPYRERYYDRPDAHYRYSDGYIYQVDPETRLIAAAIELIAS